jgi:hypothetical protein
MPGCVKSRAECFRSQLQHVLNNGTIQYDNTQSTRAHTRDDPSVALQCGLGTLLPGEITTLFFHNMLRIHR